MIRFVLILLATVFAITLLRGIAGIVMKAAADLFSPSGQPPAKRPDIPLSGELKRDPVCGTYVSAATSVKRSVGGQVVHYCSAECRDKHRT